METQIICALIFILISAVQRFALFKKPMEKPKAGWFCFGYAILATVICTLISNGQQSTLITGFATMLITYNILIYTKK